MKRLFFIFLSLTYLMTALHGIVPHCHGECKDDVSAHCSTNLLEDDHAFLMHVLAEFFENAVHPELEGEMVFHVVNPATPLVKSNLNKSPLPFHGLVQDHTSTTFVRVGTLEYEAQSEKNPTGLFICKNTNRGPPLTI